jgi:cupin superfamily acireductone dioxygenase involved in methionine salvage
MMAANLLKLLSEGKSYLWALRHGQQRGLTEETINGIRETLASEGIDLLTLAALRALEPGMARFAHPSLNTLQFNDFYFFPIPAFDIEVYFKTAICEPGLELGMELFTGKVDWQFSHDEVQYCIGGDTEVDMIYPNNEKNTKNVKKGDVVAVPAGTNFITYSTEEDGRFGHAHMFLWNGGGITGQIYYDVAGMLRLQSLGMVEAAPEGALPFSDISDRIEVKKLSELLTVHPARERDFPTWLRNGWDRREETRALDYAEGTRQVVVSSPDREQDEFIEWGDGPRQCFVNPLVAEQSAAIVDCHFPAGYKKLHPHKEIWSVLRGQAKLTQSIPPLHGEWVDLDIQENDVVVATGGAHIHVLEATDDFVVRRLAESCAHNSHYAMMERKLESDKVSGNI